MVSTLSHESCRFPLKRVPQSDIEVKTRHAVTYFKIYGARAAAEFHFSPVECRSFYNCGYLSDGNRVRYKTSKR